MVPIELWPLSNGLCLPYKFSFRLQLLSLLIIARIAETAGRVTPIQGAS